MDQVIFIEDGQLEMSGTPEELLATNAHYQKLYRIDRGIVLSRNKNDWLLIKANNQSFFYFNGNSSIKRLK